MDDNDLYYSVDDTILLWIDGGRNGKDDHLRRTYTHQPGSSPVTRFCRDVLWVLSSVLERVEHRNFAAEYEIWIDGKLWARTADHLCLVADVVE